MAGELKVHYNLTSKAEGENEIEKKLLREIQLKIQLHFPEK